MVKITTEDKIMLECDETLQKVTEKIQKRFKLTWDEATILVDKCFRELCIAK